mmetsp:Transcript_25453/g.49877  ORF Transcript_25453/g.49877 Transcript_25453/m.49877 type:complete len:325 (-) Transcript_25453:176-1150(-)
MIAVRKKAAASASSAAARRSSSHVPSAVLLAHAQWQGEGGANAQGIVRGSGVVSRVLAKLVPCAAQVSTPCIEAPSFPDPRPTSAFGIRFHEQLAQQAMAAASILDTMDCNVVLTAGGDCSSDLAPCSWLLERYGADLAVLYVDAHADLNSPEESPSGNFHGMVLRALLGDVPTLSPRQALSPSAVLFAGLRELDSPEKEAIHRLGIAALPPVVLQGPAGSATLMSCLRGLGRKRLHIHLDLDVLDPSEFPHVSVPSRGGLCVKNLQILLQAVGASQDLVGLTVTEARPLSVADEEACEVVLQELLGPSGLDLAACISRCTGHE